MLPSLRLENGFGFNGGYLYIPAREGLRPSGDALDAGDQIEASWAHADPRNNHFNSISVRVHDLNGWEDFTRIPTFDEPDIYYPSDPWESTPWAGSTSAGGTGASFTVAPFFSSPWDTNGFKYCIVGVSDSPGDVVSYSGAVTGTEQYSFDLAGYGHVGYSFCLVPFGTGNITISFASGVGPVKKWAVMRIQATGTASELGTNAETIGASGTARPLVTLGYPVADYAAVCIASCSRGPNHFMPADAHMYPDVEIYGLRAQSNLRPMYRIDGRLYPIQRYIGGLGQVGDP